MATPKLKGHIIPALPGYSVIIVAPDGDSPVLDLVPIVAWNIDAEADTSEPVAIFNWTSDAKAVLCPDGTVIAAFPLETIYQTLEAYKADVITYSKQ